MSEACDIFFLKDSEKTNCLCVGECDLNNDQTLSRLVDKGRFQRHFAWAQNLGQFLMGKNA